MIESRTLSLDLRASVSKRKVKRDPFPTAVEEIKTMKLGESICPVASGYIQGKVSATSNLSILGVLDDCPLGDLNASHAE